MNTVRVYSTEQEAKSEIMWNYAPGRTNFEVTFDPWNGGYVLSHKDRNGATRYQYQDGRWYTEAEVSH